MPVPSPEEMQYALGIHPEQMAAAQAAMAAAGQGDQPASDDVLPIQPRVRPRPLSTDQPEQPQEKPAETVPLIPRHSMISRGAPRALDVPPVGTPGPMPGTAVASSAPDSTGSIPLAKSEDVGPVGSVPGTKTDTGGVSDLMRTPIKPISADQAAVQADQGREAKDRAELERLQATGSGVDQFQHKHHILGRLVKGLSIAGSIISPGAAALIPGTDLHHQVLVNQARGNVGQDIADEKEHSTMADHNEANAAREQNIQGHLNAANAKFVAGSEKEDPNSPTGYTAQTIGGEWKPYTPPASYKQTKGESFSDIQTRRGQEADHLQLTGDDRKYYLANGKVPEPRPHYAGAGEKEFDEWKEAFRVENGRDPNAQDISDFKHGNKAAGGRQTFKDPAAIDKYSNDWYAKQRKAVLDEKNKVHSLNPDANGDDKQLQQEYTRIENEYAQRAADFENQKKNWYAQIQSGRPVKVAEPEGGGVPQADTSDIPQPIASVRTPGSPAPIGGPVQTPQTPAKPSPVTQAKPGSDLGPAPDKSPEGRTGKLPDGTKVIVKGGRLVAQ